MGPSDWLEKDYYKVLGVSKDAKPEEIKKAFRKLARANHPDQHPGDAKAEARFKEASEANSVLSDPKKRAEYDEQRSLLGGFRMPRGGQPGGFGGAPSMEDLLRGATGGSADIGDLLGSFLGQQGGRRGPARRAARRGQDIEGEVTIDFEQAVEGTTVSMQTASDSPCTACHGTGAKSGSVPKVCPTCQGSGVVAGAGGMFSSGESCPTCRGRGMTVDDPCPSCHGSGREMSTKTMQVRIPAGVTDGQKIRIKGRGGAGEGGGPSGDLIIGVGVRPHPLFGRKGDSLTLAVPVLFTEAALGADIEVPTLRGPSVRLRVPAGTPNGRTFRVRGKGVAKKDGARGDLLVSVEVAVPSHLDADARAALEGFRDALHATDPRAGLLSQG